MKNPKFILYNHNPKGLKVGDCVIRALGFALNKTWFEVYDDLSKIARVNCWAMNDINTIKEYLKPFQQIEVKRNINNKIRRLTINDICDLEGVYIVRVAHHITAVKDKKFYDLFDCGHKSSYIIWKVNA